MATGAPITFASHPTPPRREAVEQKRSVDIIRGDNDVVASPQTSSYGLPRGRQRRLTQSHQKLVFPDPVAFRYLEEDNATIVIDRRRKLQGYEIYIVEQWACSRTHPTFMICTHTGDPSHSILVNILAVPNDESTWSPRLQVYFEAISQSYAREKETPLGTLMVTNLSGFPSSLTVINVPDGDVRKHREDFIVNENLKRMGCAGRAALNLNYPQAVTIAKFHHLYRTSESVPLYPSVMEVVRLCQQALVLYGELEATFADGLLCDITEKAISDWWNNIGTDFHNVDPSDGILGPTTVSALLGLMIGAFNRLKATGATVGKDPIDIPAFKRAIGHFQKSQKMEKTRRLDRATLDRLHRATAKTAAGEGWRVPNAVKSTVAEFSGKGGEMVASAFGGREKVGISEVETLDIERLAELVAGSKMKWLWQGKPIKTSQTDILGLSPGEVDGRTFSTDDQGSFIWTGTTRGVADEASEVKGNTDHADRKLGRLRDAVPALRSHNSRLHKDEDGPFQADDARSVAGSARLSKDDIRMQALLYRAPLSRHPPLNLALAQASTTKSPVSGNSNLLKAEAGASKISASSHRQMLNGIDKADQESPGKRRVREEMADMREKVKEDFYQSFSGGIDFDLPRSKALRRSQSNVLLRNVTVDKSARVPRHLSFSLIEGNVLRTDSDSRKQESVGQEPGLRQALAVKQADTAQAQVLAIKLARIFRGTIPYTESKVEHVEVLDQEARSHLEELNNMYYARLEEYQTLQATSTDLVAREKSGLSEGLRRIEMLGAKLDYELNSLHSRMQEVEDGVDEFERSVIETEARVKELINVNEPRRNHWFQRIISLIGPR